MGHKNVKCFKIECSQAAEKLRNLIKIGGSFIEGPFDGEEGITLYEDLEAGATGNMSSAMIPDLIRPVVLDYFDGEFDKSEDKYNNILPLINY